MKLNNKQKRFLKGKAHALEPAVTVGNKGLSESVIDELNNALSRHELIKVKIPAGPKAERQALTEGISAQALADVLALTGRVVILFRLNPEKTNSLVGELRGMATIISTT